MDPVEPRMARFFLVVGVSDSTDFIGYARKNRLPAIVIVAGLHRKGDPGGCHVEKISPLISIAKGDLIFNIFQIQIEKRGIEEHAIEDIENPPMPGNERGRVLYTRISLVQRLDQIAGLPQETAAKP